MIVEGGEARLSSVYRARLERELERADAVVPGSTSIRSQGDPSAPILAVKGSPGPAELGGGIVLAGADGDAWGKAIEALGWDRGDSYAVISRPIVDAPAQSVSDRLRHIIEACDPVWVVALDDQAAADVASSLDASTLRVGQKIRIKGRNVLALAGLEASLTDEDLKRRVWGQMKPLGESAE